MGLIYFRLLRRDDKQDDSSGGGGLNTTAQIAIGVIVPIIVLLGGLIYFIWRTESRRRVAKVEDNTHSSSRLHDFLRRKDAMRGSRLIDSPQLEKARPEMDSKDRHELGDTSFMHELEDAGSPIYEINKPLPMHPPRKDSAVNNAMDTQIDTYEAPARTQRYSELPTRKPEAARQSTASSNYRHSTVGAVRYSTTTSPPPTSGWRASLQPTSLLGGFANKRDRRVSKAASSRYSNQNFDMIDPRSRRSDEGKRSDDSAISPPVSAIEDIDLSRQLSDNHPRVSAVVPVSDSPAWMKRLSVQDTVNQKWKGSGELIGPEDHKI